MTQLRGANALVTGTSRGLGPYIAQALAARGANVVVTARARAPLEGLMTHLRQCGVRAEMVAADLMDSSERTALAVRAVESLGGIDVLVNNAGIESEGAFTSLDEQTIAATIETNLTAPMHLARLLLPAMLERRRGHIVNISSIGGQRGAPYDAVYCGTKAGLIEWGNALRGELGGTGVHVSTICPGYVTGAGMFARFDLSPPSLLGSCTPEQVARATVRALHRNAPEVIVNSRPLRPLLAFGALFPRLADRVVDLLGITEFQRRKVGG